MAKISFTDILSGYSTASAITANFDSIEDHLNNKILYRDNPTGEPNQMENDLDMNSNRIYNLPSAVGDTEPATWGQLKAAGTNITFTGTDVEVQVATASQTVFILTGVNYTPGAANLSVYINGVRQSPSSYTETSSTVVTFSDGLDLGDQVQFVVNERQVDTSTTPATSVTLTVGSTDYNVDQVIAEGVTHYVATIAALQANTETFPTVIVVKNHSTAGDQGGGTFWRDDADTTSADNSGTIVVDANSKRWKRINSENNVNAKWFGATGDGTTDDTSAIQAAIDYAATTNGGTVFLPEGSYLITGLSIPAFVYLRGSGERGTRLLFNASSDAIAVGGTASSVYYNCGVTDLSIIMTDTAATGIRSKGVVGGEFSSLYIEGPIAASRTTAGIIIDGANASSFFNDVKDVICNHIHTGYQLLTSGSQLPTNTNFRNCSNFGDVSTDTTSICLLVATNCGNGSTWNGGNAEACGYGLYYQTSAGSTVIEGLRLEGNTLDIYLDTTPNQQTFIGLINLNQAKISDNSGTGWDKHSYIGCIDSNAVDTKSPYNVFPGSNQFKSLAAGNTPITTLGFPAQAATIQDNKNSSGTVISGIAADSNYYGNHFKFPATQVPSSDVNALDDYEEGTFSPIIGGDGGTSGQTYNFQNGKYTKIGNQVTVNGDVYLSAKGTITGNVIIDLNDLPFNCNGTVPASMDIGYSSLATSTVDVKASMITGTNTAYLRIKTAAATAPSLATTTDISNSTEIIFSATFFV